ncbi:ABC transporter ATP-binding protein [Paenibacillus ginsengarvi]|uniref:ABC transporter ATP-binding protein n=1 Tax=Paenibacillus ginsengarvi TaxID=400777 RepID=A0A3B0CKR5_9BACL|nr:ABC transporter ATP-binding protein [Paenibacillus ginsengarvi]RKN85560.1 ABC transporter ATP-binding protein [Paenibacillus ginsengarvi]
MSLIRMEGVGKRYSQGGETLKVLDGISLDIGQGEFVAIVGPSGSGKSTLMNVLGCLDVADEGLYELDGTAVRSMKDSELAVIRNRKIGFVFQSFNLLPRLTAFENVELPLIYRGLGRKKREAAALRALDDVDLLNRKDHRPAQLSGGQQQRVAIARALAGDPPILLADEPTGSLDSATGAELLSLLKRLSEQGKTIVMITHDAAVAQQARRIVTILDGKIVHEAIIER